MGVVHHLVVVFLVLVFPIWDRYETARLKQSADPSVRIRSYQTTIAWQWLVAVLLFATLPASALLTPPSAAVLVARRYGIAVVPVILGLMAGIALPVLLGRLRKGSTPLMRQLQEIAFVLPRTAVERWWFAALAVSVGVCEEVIFRGFLVRYVQQLPLHPGLAGSVVIAALIFGLDHGYQGVKGMIGTTVLALVMTAVFFGTGHLWPAMVMHTLIDLRILLLRPDRGPDGEASGA